MNKEGFNQLVADYSKVDRSFQDLENLVNQYPYSQPVRMLNIKSSTRLSKVEFQKRLGLAAFYTTDRNVLRSLIEDGVVPSDAKQKAKPAGSPTGKAQLPGKTKVVAKKPKLKVADVDALRNEVMANLAKLQKSKAHFLELTEEGEVEIAQPKEPVKRALKKTTPKKKAIKSTSEKSIRKGIKEKPKAARSKTSKDVIIDKFIAEEPSISPGVKSKDNQSDLSKPSSVLKEDLVSENLAIIFANQGKTAKAIEIYKKLIWKFPQKKASFAARIEELKKK